MVNVTTYQEGMAHDRSMATDPKQAWFAYLAVSQNHEM